MTDEMMRLLDSVCKGYECADLWVRRYNDLFADYTAMRNQYEENRNHKAFHDAQSAAHIANLNEKLDILKSDYDDLKNAYERAIKELRISKVSMGMKIFDLENE